MSRRSSVASRAFVNKQTLPRGAIQPGSHHRLRTWTPQNESAPRYGSGRNGTTGLAPYAMWTTGNRHQISGRSKTWRLGRLSIRWLGLPSDSVVESRCCSSPARTAATSSPSMRSWLAFDSHRWLRVTRHRRLSRSRLRAIPNRHDGDSQDHPGRRGFRPGGETDGG